ncbi:hypothetical protein B0H16DRAFT_1463485 [Mycena metata]|uniref:Uncharacterized protein n=1 Tax=Mycena metata TaxID=1033252 RepID=A0AAD7N3C6_9AGAR|nr:hypothetical protein B0H16DRAFT_1463485 [Mycena metata]
MSSLQSGPATALPPYSFKLRCPETQCPKIHDAPPAAKLDKEPATLKPTLNHNSVGKPKTRELGTVIINGEAHTKESFLDNVVNPVGGEHKKGFLCEEFSNMDATWMLDQILGIQDRAKLEGSTHIQGNHLLLEESQQEAICSLSHLSTLVQNGMVLPDNKVYFLALSPEQHTNAITIEHAKGYTAWHHKIEPMIRMRNRFVDLYMAYGPVIFLDPFWDVHTLTKDTWMPHKGYLDEGLPRAAQTLC